MWRVFYYLLVFGVLANGLTDEQYAQFPRLYHLDDYQACLAPRGGLYCLGSFHLAPLQEEDPIFNMMVEYSKDPLTFNRTQLHRGYCVSSRCPDLRPSRVARDIARDDALADADASNETRGRFERCVARWARTRGFNVSTKRVQYCTTTEQKKANAEITMDEPKLIFLAVIFCILFLNVVGTVYDLSTPDADKKNKYLMCWSCRANWRRLTASYEDGDPRLSALSPLQGMRVLIMLLVIWMHCGLIHFMAYSYNPEFLEKMIKGPQLMLVKNGTSLVQVFVMLSSFLLAYNLLLYSRSHPLSLWMLPKCILTRIVRITPVYLLVVGFAASWWPAMGDGPMWPASVAAESAICARKFWAQALFVNNFVQPDDHCLIQTWFLAVDFQLFVVSSVLTLALARCQARSVAILSALLVGAILLNGALAYAFKWKTMLFIMNPESLKSMYHGVSSFTYLYLSPWGSLPASLMGLLMAHLHFQLQERGFKMAEHKWLVWLYHWSIPLIIALIMSGTWLQGVDASEAALAAHVAFERPVFCALSAVCLFGMFHNIDNPVRRIANWRGWSAAARCSLAVLMLHWLVHASLAAAAPQPLHTSYTNIIWDWTATSCLTYLAAVPLTVLVEFPVQRLAVTILS